MFTDIIEKAKSHGAELIILFGSRAKGKERETSDIDICIVAETDKKRRLASILQAEIESEYPIDILIYTPKEWEECVADKTSFASKIYTEGRILYGQPKIS
ncbi:MAG: nucleotidyltransferase domain-containing protein [Clostridia bacterium]|nr:nucleotidyltransferase domain-containing protein [Clostridia bacterium]